MGVAAAITRRPWIVIGVWVIIAAISFPLFINLHSVVKEQVYTLPSSSEASRAMKLAEKVNGGGGSHTGIIVVDGVDLSDNDTLVKLVEAGKRLNESIVGRYASKITSLPTILAETNATLYRAMLEAVNGTSSGARKLYQTLVELDKAYQLALNNASKQVAELNKTLTGIMAADKGFAEAYKGLLGLRSALNNTITGLRSLDEAYSNTTNRLELLARNITVLAERLREADKAYAGFYQNTTQSARRLLGVLGNQSLVARLEQGLGYTWWQVSRAYYYLSALNGNYTGYVEIANLSNIDPRLAPLPQSQALYALKAVGALVEKGVPVDAASLSVAAAMFSQQAPREAQQILPVIVEAWNVSLNNYYASHNTSCIACYYRLGREAPQSQLLVWSIAGNISRSAAEWITSSARSIAASIIAKALSSKGVPPSTAREIAVEAVNGRLNTTLVALLVASMAAEKTNTSLSGNTTRALAEILVAFDPGAEGTLYSNRTLSITAAAKMIEEMGAPGRVVEKLASLLARSGGLISRRELAELALEVIGSRVGGEAKPLVQVIAKADPEARGVLAYNSTLAARIAAQVVYEAASRQGHRVDRGVVERIAAMIVRGDAGDRDIARLALQELESRIKEEKGEKAAEAITAILEKYDPQARGVLASNRTLAIQALYWFAEKQGHKIPFRPRDLEKILSDTEALRRQVASLFINMSAEKAPAEMRELAKKLASIVVEKGPSIPVEEKWAIVENLLREEAGKHSWRGGGVEVPSRIRDKIIGLAVRVARNETGLSEAAKKLAIELLLGEVAPKLISKAKGLMVSKDLQAFSIMLAPLGSTQEERAGNLERAGNITKSVLGAYGLEPRIYVSGEDVVLQQVRSYAVRDAENTSKLSEIGIFVVLLVLLESVLAVFLPYLGIILGLAVGGAIVYLAAASGVIDFSSHTQSIMMTTALGLGADYAGYLIYRFKEEYAATNDPREAAKRSLERAGPAIVASALTVIIGFGSLLLAWDISFLRGFGEAIPIAVAATAAATLTLVPALLSLVGGKKWFWWPRRPKLERIAGKRSRVMAALIRHEKLVLVGMAVLILVAGYFYASFHGTHDMKLMLPSGAPALEAFNVMSEKFEAGITDPIIVVVELNGNLWSDPGAWKQLDSLASALAEIHGVARVLGPTRPMGEPVDNATIAERMGGKGFTSSDGRIALLQVILAVDPYTRRGEETVSSIHRVAHEQAGGLRVYVDGSPYATLEMDEILTQEFYYRVLPGAALLMIAVFTLIFGGLWVSIASLVVIIGAAMTGIMASTLLFQNIYGEEMLWFMHIVTLAAVMGVGMDYNSFFLARALEECHKTSCDPKESVIRASGKVSLFIIGLSLVVTTAYAMLLAASNTGMREMGFALAVTVFTAALMAAYLLTPIVVSMLGEKAWWPWGMRRRISH